MNRTTLYEEQAAYCAYLLRRALDPKRRRLLEREREDWLLLADQDRLWAALDAAAQPAPFPGRG